MTDRSVWHWLSPPHPSHTEGSLEYNQEGHLSWGQGAQMAMDQCPGQGALWIQPSAPQSTGRGRAHR